MKYKFFHLHEENSIGFLKINRPPVNAFNFEVIRELNDLIETIEGDKSIKLVLIIGNDRVFSAGADINMLKNSNVDDLMKFLELCQKTLRKIETLPKIVIAVIEGHCVGGGLELALACDFRFMANGENKIGFPEVKIGVITPWGTTFRLARLLGKSQALDLIINGKLVDADEALRIGLVNRIYPPGDLMTKAIEYAKGIVSGATIAISMAKKCLNEVEDEDFREACFIESKCQRRLFYTDDFKEGVTAFLEKRNPKFKGE